MTFSSIDEIPTSKAILDADADLVKAIERANFAMLDVLILMHSRQDPIALNLFGINPETLAIIVEMKNKLGQTMRTGVPFFEFKLKIGELGGMLNSETNVDDVFKSLLKTFSNEISLRSL